MNRESSPLVIALRITWYICSGIGILMLILLPWLADVLSYVFPVCPSKLQGVSCWFCGGTRGIRAVMNGNIQESFRLNPFSFLSIICMCLNTCIFLQHIFKRFKTQ